MATWQMCNLADVGQNEILGHPALGEASTGLTLDASGGLGRRRLSRFPFRGLVMRPAHPLARRVPVEHRYVSKNGFPLTGDPAPAPRPQAGHSSGSGWLPKPASLPAVAFPNGSVFRHVSSGPYLCREIAVDVTEARCHLSLGRGRPLRAGRGELRDRAVRSSRHPSLHLMPEATRMR